LAIGQRLWGLATLGVFGVQMFTLRREQGRLQVSAFLDTEKLEQPLDTDSIIEEPDLRGEFSRQLYGLGDDSP
jgi:hypothetical protein